MTDITFEDENTVVRKVTSMHIRVYVERNPPYDHRTKTTLMLEDGRRVTLKSQKVEVEII